MGIEFERLEVLLMFYYNIRRSSYQDIDNLMPFITQTMLTSDPAIWCNLSLGIMKIHEIIKDKLTGCVANIPSQGQPM